MLVPAQRAFPAGETIRLRSADGRGRCTMETHCAEAGDRALRKLAPDR
nr:MAG TPA: hypothetical protein [Caudoviricetes sp.]